METYVIKPEKRHFIEEHFFEWSFGKPEGYLPDKAVFLQLTHPAELHCLAEIYNWDDGAIVLEWILDSPLCTRATTNLLFWRTCPDYYLQFDIDDENGCIDCNSEGFKFLRKIIQKYKDNTFSSYQIEFDPKGEVVMEEIDETKSKWSFPPGVYDMIKGVRILAQD